MVQSQFRLVQSQCCWDKLPSSRQAQDVHCVLHCDVTLADVGGVPWVLKKWAWCVIYVGLTIFLYFFMFFDWRTTNRDLTWSYPVNIHELYMNNGTPGYTENPGGWAWLKPMSGCTTPGSEWDTYGNTMRHCVKKNGKTMVKPVVNFTNNQWWSCKSMWICFHGDDHPLAPPADVPGREAGVEAYGRAKHGSSGNLSHSNTIPL